MKKVDGRIGDPVLLGMMQKGTQLLDVVAHAMDSHEWHRYYLLLEQRAISDTS